MRARSLVSGLLLAVPAVAMAWPADVHEILTAKALHDAGVDGPVGAIDPGSPAALRGQIDDYARHRAAPEVQAEWAKRYPTPESFDAWAEKELLLFAPEATVGGVDGVDAAGPTIADRLVAASAAPESDSRNRDRVAHGPDRKPLLGADGEPIPDDPATLGMAQLGDSELHAHMAMADVTQSDDMLVLSLNPRGFVVTDPWPPGPLLAIAPEMAQEHLDLAILAALSGRPDAQDLSWLYTGQALHYLEDVGSPLRTVQVGLSDFWDDAWKDRFRSGLFTAGGYVGRMQRLAPLGLAINENHRAIAETLVVKRLREAAKGEATPDFAPLYSAIAEGDIVYNAKMGHDLMKMQGPPERGEFGLRLARFLVEATSTDGPPTFRATRGMVDPRFRTAAVRFDPGKDDPDAALAASTPETDADRADFWKRWDPAFRETGGAVRSWLVLEKKLLDEAAASPEEAGKIRDEVLDRLVKRQLKMRADAEARQAQFRASPPPEPAPEHAPEILVGEIAALVVGGVLIAFIVALIRTPRVSFAKEARDA